MKKLTTILLLAALLIPVAADAAETYSGRVLERDGLLYKPNSNVPLTATVERYYENGQLKLLYTSVHGKGQGLGQSWHDNGQRYVEATSVDGKREGLVRVWHDNGQLQAEYTFVNDKEEGLLRLWPAVRCHLTLELCT